jgi:hypothetical protein
MVRIRLLIVNSPPSSIVGCCTVTPLNILSNPCTTYVIPVKSDTPKFDNLTFSIKSICPGFPLTDIDPGVTLTPLSENVP